MTIKISVLKSKPEVVNKTLMLVAVLSFSLLTLPKISESLNRQRYCAALFSVYSLTWLLILIVYC